MDRFPMLRSEKRKQVFFEDVEVGSAIPTVVKGPYTVVHMAMFASVIRNFSPTHFDNKWAQGMGHQGAFAPGLQVSVYQSQVLTDWMGPNGMLRKFRARTRGMAFDRDTLSIKGRVTRKYVKDGENYVECEVSIERQDGKLVMDGTATVTLPSRG